MANTFANGLRIAAQKRPMTGPKGPMTPTAQPVMPQPALELNPRPSTESGFPAPAAAPGVPPVAPQQASQPSLIQDLLRKRRELGI